jgi:hypothetical protein
MRHTTSFQRVRLVFRLSPRFLIFDRHRKYGVEVPAAVRSLAFESPWQNGVAERWIESCRRELLDLVIAVNERHLKRLLFDYVRYHHEDRTHLGLGKEHRRGGFVPQTPGALFFTIDSVDCIIATTGLPKTISLR